MAAAAPVYIPVLALCYHIFMFLMYDFDAPSSDYNIFSILGESLVWNTLLCGICQIALSLIGLVLYPVAGIAVLLYGLLRFILRSLWDFHMYHLFIKPCGRVPAVDDFLARRISGPGIGTELFYLLKPEQALIALETELSRQTLKGFKNAMLKEILKPKELYENFIRTCFEPFAVSLNDNREPFSTMVRKCENLADILGEKCLERNKQLEIVYLMTHLNKSKLKAADLKVGCDQDKENNLLMTALIMNKNPFVLIPF